VRRTGLYFLDVFGEGDTRVDAGENVQVILCPTYAVEVAVQVFVDAPDIGV
jgi:hypothetical protein